MDHSMEDSEPLDPGMEDEAQPLEAPVEDMGPGGDAEDGELEVGDDPDQDQGGAVGMAQESDDNMAKSAACPLAPTARWTLARLARGVCGTPQKAGKARVRARGKTR